MYSPTILISVTVFIIYILYCILLRNSLKFLFYHDFFYLELALNLFELNSNAIYCSVIFANHIGSKKSINFLEKQMKSQNILTAIKPADSRLRQKQAPPYAGLHQAQTLPKADSPDQTISVVIISFVFLATRVATVKTYFQFSRIARKAH
jgi:hypothetical protein